MPGSVAAAEKRLTQLVHTEPLIVGPASFNLRTGGEKIQTVTAVLHPGWLTYVDGEGVSRSVPGDRVIEIEWA